MSKLGDKIRRATRLQPQPLGFGTATAALEPTMVLGGFANDVRAAAEIARRGADVVIVDLTKGVSGSAKDAGAPLGALVAGKADGEATACKDAGFDFVVFDPDKATATALMEESISYVLVLPKDLSDAELRALEGFALDAIDIGKVDGALTVRRQIDLRRIFALARKPLMATVPASISVSELQALRDTNVVVAVAERADDVERLRKTIDALPPRSKRKDHEDRPTPFVPHGAMEEHEHDEDEE